MYEWREPTKKEMGKKCANCGAKKDTAKICTHCGEIFCSPRCGIKHYQEEDFDFIVKVNPEGGEG